MINNKEAWCFSAVECTECNSEHNAVFYMGDMMLECPTCDKMTEHLIIGNIKEIDYEDRES